MNSGLDKKLLFDCFLNFRQVFILLKFTYKHMTKVSLQGLIVHLSQVSLQGLDKNFSIFY